MKVQVCNWKSCKSRFSEYILKRLESDKQKFSLETLNVENCPCMGLCKDWPNISIDWKVENHSEWARISKIVLEKLKVKKKS